MNKDEYYEKSINALERHADTSNHEVGLIQKDIVVIQNDVKWIKEWVGSMDKKLWAIIVLLIGTAIKIFIN